MRRQTGALSRWLRGSLAALSLAAVACLPGCFKSCEKSQRSLTPTHPTLPAHANWPAEPPQNDK